jgi:hypothetical protein
LMGLDIYLKRNFIEMETEGLPLFEEFAASYGKKENDNQEDDSW